ncbi:gelsolin-related protein of 125 kDa-like [Periplaneta americana]|uniref:gelsolin-related protein of 125 kDa-like n=1 Tax=Periplaneta americana TaxID=6978 RepID=UPI0037E8BC4F
MSESKEEPKRRYVLRHTPRSERGSQNTRPSTSSVQNMVKCKGGVVVRRSPEKECQCPEPKPSLPSDKEMVPKKISKRRVSVPHPSRNADLQPEKVKITVMYDYLEEPDLGYIRHRTPKSELQPQDTTPRPRVREMAECEPCKPSGSKESDEEPKEKRVKFDVKEEKGTQETKEDGKEKEVEVGKNKNGVMEEKNKQEVTEQEVMEEKDATEELQENMLRCVVSSSTEENIPEMMEEQNTTEEPQQNMRCCVVSSSTEDGSQMIEIIHLN